MAPGSSQRADIELPDHGLFEVARGMAMRQMLRGLCAVSPPLG